MPSRLSQVRFSLLDPVESRISDANMGDAFHRKGRLIRFVESIGYSRYWFMHAPPSPDQGATAAILLSHLAALSNNIRIGTDALLRTSDNRMAAGKTYALLHALYPDRVEGIQTGPSSGWSAEKIEDLLPGTFPFWALCTDITGAELAGKNGWPFAFASHFAPARLMDALEKYRSSFRPSAILSKPEVVACVHAIVAETDEEADFLAGSLYQMVLGLLTQKSGPLLPPQREMETIASEKDWMAVRRMLWYSFFGNSETVRQSLQTFVEQTAVDEVMICSAVFDERKEWASLRAIAELFS